MNKKEWLENLKAGDRVIISVNSSHSLATVSRVTATQIVIKNTTGLGVDYDVKYSRERGYKISSDKWHSEILEIPTPDLLEKIEERIDRKRFQIIADNNKTIIEVRAMLSAYDLLQGKSND